MNDKYVPIIDLPHHTSTEHPRMSKEARAAQFAPFAALTGFEDLVKETGRSTDSQKELTEDRKSEIDLELHRLMLSGECSEIVYFVPDTRKSGGKYLKTVGRIVRFDEYERTVILEGGARIPIDRLIDLRPYKENDNESEKRG